MERTGARAGNATARLQCILFPRLSNGMKSKQGSGMLDGCEGMAAIGGHEAGHNRDD